MQFIASHVRLAMTIPQMILEFALGQDSARILDSRRLTPAARARVL
jgi:NAD dependent epimerase/dehydratase family enzyme